MRARPMHAALAVLVALVGLGAWLWLDSSRIQLASPPAAGRNVPPPAVAAAPPVSPAARPARFEVGSPGDGERDTAGSQGVRDLPFELHGKLTMVDATGHELSPVDGELRLIAWAAFGNVDLKAPVRAGEWRVPLERRERVTHLTLSAFDLDGQARRIESPRGDLPVPPDGYLEVRVRESVETLLQVRDAATHRELSGVTVVSVPGQAIDVSAHPGVDFAERILVADARSPFDLPDERPLLFAKQIRRLLIGAEGYAWARREVDASRGPYVVGLERGGDLEVELHGVDPRLPTELRLRLDGAAGPHASVRLDGDGPVLLRGLPGREFLVSVETGEWWAHPFTVAAARVRITVGETARVQLDLPPLPYATSVAAAGRFLVPKAWRLERATFGIERQDPPDGPMELPQMGSTARSEAAGGECDVFEWRFEKLRPGRHRIGLVEPGFGAFLDVPPGGIEGVELRVPDPATLRVRIVDAASGADVEGVQVMWSAVGDSGERATGIHPAEFDARTHVHTIRAPIGQVALDVWDWRYLPCHERADVERGESEVTLRMVRACGLSLALRDGDVPIPIPETWYQRPQPVDGTEGEPTLTQIDGGVLRVMLSSPGSYTLLPPKLEDYRQPPLERFDVLPGRFTERVVQLERERR